MTRDALALCCCVLLSSACYAPSRARAADGPMGTWRFVDYVVWDSAGTPRQLLGPTPSGYVVFDATGHAFIQLMRPADARTFGAYYGTWAVDSGGRVLRIAVEGANAPEYLGTNQFRPFQIRRDTLVLGVVREYQATLVRVPSRP